MNQVSGEEQPHYFWCSFYNRETQSHSYPLSYFLHGPFCSWYLSASRVQQSSDHKVSRAKTIAAYVLTERCFLG